VYQKTGPRHQGPASNCTTTRGREPGKKLLRGGEGEAVAGRGQGVSHTAVIGQAPTGRGGATAPRREIETQWGLSGEATKGPEKGPSKKRGGKKKN